MISRFITSPAILVAALGFGLSALMAPPEALAQQRQAPQQRAPAQPQTPAELPAVGTSIVVADVILVLRDAAAVQSIRAQLEKQRSAYQAEVQKQENELRNADQDLAKQRAILSPEAFAQRRRELEKRVGDAQQNVQDRRRSLDSAFNTAMQKVGEAMDEVIRDIAQERRYQIVLAKTQIVTFENGLDITPEVMRRLNRKLPTVTVSIPQH